MTEQEKWRAIKRQERKLLSDSVRIQANQTIVEQVIASQAFATAATIGCYLPLAEEVDVMPIIEAALRLGKNVYVPVVIARGEALQFAPYSHASLLTKDCLGMTIPDVPQHAYCDAKDLELVITPLVAFDESNNRIGMGGGFYDRTFFFKHQNYQNSTRLPTLMGVAFSCQKVETNIEPQPWDIQLDEIITENYNV